VQLVTVALTVFSLIRLYFATAGVEDWAIFSSIIAARGVATMRKNMQVRTIINDITTALWKASVQQHVVFLSGGFIGKETGLERDNDLTVISSNN